MTTTTPKCQEMVFPRSQPRIMSKGTETTVPGTPRQCSRNAVEGDFMCAVHAAKREQIKATLAKRKAKATGAEQDVPPTTAIRTRSVPNVPAGRLLARLDYLRVYITRSAEWAEQKGDFKARVREILNLERELRARGVHFQRVSR